MDCPKLRYGVEVLPVQVEGKTMLLLRDQLGLCGASLVISPATAQILMNMDGSNSLRDLQAQYMRVTGQLVHIEEIQGLEAKLDEHLFLDNDRFNQRLTEEHKRFAEDPVRRMTHAGQSYPGDPALLKQELASYFLSDAGGPGAPQQATSPHPLLGLVAPHIDIKAGGPCYANAYKTLCESRAPQTWVILGTGHQPLQNFFALTLKDFETPLGLLRCDQECGKTFLQRAPRDVRVDEYAHCREHTIEFQAVFLALCQPRAQIVPILCSFSLEDFETEQGYIDDVAAILGELASTCGYPVGFLASVDLAHIGPRYGDRHQPHAGTVREHLEADRELLATLEDCEPDAFMQKLRREHNRRRICGLAPLYVLAKVLEGQARGKVLHHAHAIVDQHNSFVSFASMAFFANVELE
jgi:AmmeMemoRadiSam system protein B